MFNAGHPEDDVLEQYAMAQLPAATAESLEEHVLVCASCQDRLDFTETYVRSMKAAMASAEKAPQKQPWLTKAGGWFQMPLPVWAQVAAVLLIGVGAVVGTQYFHSPGAPVAMVLTANRGETASVTAGTPLALKLDARDLAPEAAYRVQIVNGEGADVWDQAPASVQDGFVRIVVNKHLTRGQYFVRLSRQDAGTPREYALQVR